jgi:multiple sugar transport system substrate-binding protein
VRVRAFRPANLRCAGAALAVALLATACVTGGDTGGRETQAGGDVKPRIAKEPQEPTTVTFASWVGESPQMKKFAEDFQNEHPNITIEFANVPAERATDKLLTQVAGGNAPDVAFMDQAAVEDFASRKALVNLDSYIAGSEVIEPDDYVEGFKAAAEYRGSMFGLPFDGETTGLFYRTDMFEQAGIDGPPETWQELEETAAKLTDEANKTYGWILFAPESQYYWYPFLWQAGGELLSQDGKEIAFDTPEAKKSAEFYVGLRKYSPPDYFNSNSWDGRVAFATGKVAMYMAGSWFGGEMKVSFPKINGKWDVAPLPAGPEGRATTLAGDALVVFDQSDNHDAAWLWIEYLSRPENMEKWTFGSKTSTLLPPRQSLLDDPDLGKFNPWLEGFADNMKYAVTSNVSQPKWPEVEWGPLNQSLGKAIYGEISAAEALEKAAAEGEKILQGDKQ